MWIRLKYRKNEDIDMTKKTYKFGLYDSNNKLIDSTKFEYDKTNYNTPWQQAGDYLVPETERDYYEAGELDAYVLPNGKERFIKELKGHRTRAPSKKCPVRVNFRKML